MSSKRSPLESQVVDGIVRLSLLDRKLVDEARIDEIADEIDRMIRAELRPKLIISFAAVDQLSSMALGMLINVHNRVRSKNGQLRLVGMAAGVYDVFRIAGLHTLFETHDSAEQAIASMS